MEPQFSTPLLPSQSSWKPRGPRARDLSRVSATKSSVPLNSYALHASLSPFYRFPFYFELKIAFVIWLLSPYTKGSSVLYRKFVHPTLSNKEKVWPHRFPAWPS